MHNGKPLLRNGVQMRTSVLSSNRRMRAASSPLASMVDASPPSARRARSPCGSMIKAGMPASAASSISAFAITVLPLPVLPSMAAWRAKTLGLMSTGSPVSRRRPRYMPFGLNLRLRRFSDGSEATASSTCSTSSAVSSSSSRSTTSSAAAGEGSSSSMAVAASSTSGETVAS